MSNSRNKARRVVEAPSPSNVTNSLMQCSRCRCVVFPQELLVSSPNSSVLSDDYPQSPQTPHATPREDTSSSFLSYTYPFGACNSCSTKLPRLQSAFPFLTTPIDPPASPPVTDANARSPAAPSSSGALESPPGAAILLGAHTMKLLGVALGDLLFLVHSDASASQVVVLPVWPSTRLPPLRARLHVPQDVPAFCSHLVRRIASCAHVHIIPYARLSLADSTTPPETPVVRCSISISQTLVQMDHILESYIQNILVGNYVFDGMCLVEKYFGQEITISLHPSPSTLTSTRLSSLPNGNVDAGIPVDRTRSIFEKFSNQMSADMSDSESISSPSTVTLDTSLQNLSLTDTPNYEAFDELSHLSALRSRRPATFLLPSALETLVPRALYRVAPSTCIQLELSANPTTSSTSQSSGRVVSVLGLERERERLGALVSAATGLSVAGLLNSRDRFPVLLSSASDSASGSLRLRLPLVPRGVLLVGPAGCGKTLLADWLLSSCACASSRISCSNSSEKPVAQLERVMNQLLLCNSSSSTAGGPGDSAEKDTLRAPDAPHVLVLDELETLCPASVRRADRTSAGDPDALRTISLLERLFACIERHPNCRLLVIGTSRRVDLIDADLRRASRFETEIELNVPSQTLRSQLLKHFWDAMRLQVVNDCPAESTLLPEADANSTSICSLIVAARTHAFTPADLLTLSRSAVLYHLIRSGSAGGSQNSGPAPEEQAQHPPGVSSGGPGTEDGEQQLCIGVSAFLSALREQQPSALREVVLDLPEWSRVRWTDVGGMRELKFRLEQLVDWPRRYPERFRRFGIKPPRGLLLFGPPGCSKTLVARALATESQLNFISIKGPEIFNKFVGESERAVRELFRKARSAAPCIVFFDEIDAIAVARRSGGGGGSDGGSGGGGSGSSGVGERILAQLLTEMDGVEQLADVLVLAATNRPDLIDRALLRPGRFDALIYVSLPDRDTRREIFRVHTRGSPLALDVDIERLADLTDKYSGAEIAAVVRHASYEALSEELVAGSSSEQQVRMLHLQKALQQVPPRTPESVVQQLQDFARRYSSFASQLGVHPEFSID